MQFKFLRSAQPISVVPAGNTGDSCQGTRTVFSAGQSKRALFFAGEEFVFGGAQQIGLVGVGRVWLFWEQHSLVLFVDYRKETFCVEGMFGLWDLSWSAVAS